MHYSVKALAKLSGVTVRTLHWYDEIGLLKPAYYQDNGYRYYEEAQLLQLQQILFFRELGFKLSDVQNLVSSEAFDQIKALNAHKVTLQNNITRMNTLIDTIDKTISHLKGEKTMSSKEIYTGFDIAKQKDYEVYLAKYYGTVAEDLILESKKRTADWETRDWTDVKNEGDAIYRALSACIDKNLSQRSDEVQALIHQHYQMIQRFYDASKDVYMGLGQLYCEHPDFRKYFDAIDPRLADYIAEAMRYYAMKHLS